METTDMIICGRYKNALYGIFYSSSKRAEIFKREFYNVMQTLFFIFYAKVGKFEKYPLEVYFCYHQDPMSKIFWKTNNLH